MFEDGVAVAELARGGVEGVLRAGAEVDVVEGVEAVLQLNAVSADVLHRRGADGAGDEREVLQPGQVVRERPFNELMPALAAAGFNKGVAGVFAHDAPPWDVCFEDELGDVAGEHDVAAAAEHKFGQIRKMGIVKDAAQLGDAGDADELLGFGVDAKGVERGEWDLGLDGEHVRIVHGHGRR